MKNDRYMKKTFTKVIILVYGFVLLLVCLAKAQDALLWKIYDKLGKPHPVLTDWAIPG